MYTLPAYRVGSRIRVGLGEHRGEEGTVLSRQRTTAAEPPGIEFGGPNAPFPKPEVYSWIYQVRLDSGVEAQFRQIELGATRGSETDQFPPENP